MSVQIKQLTNGAPVADGSAAAMGDSFNLIPGAAADTVYDIYTAPNTATAKKSALVKSIRLVNAHPTATVKVTLYFNRPTTPPSGQASQYRRRLLAPADIQLPPGFSYIDEGEITLEPGDKIQAKANQASVIQYVISGVERDVT